MQKFLKQLIFLLILAIVFSIGVFVVVAVNNRGNAPVAYWKFDEGYGTTAYDAAGSNDGTITGAQWRNEPDCKFGKCLYFDGDGDYVDAGSNSVLDNPGYLTMSAWVYADDFGGGSPRIISKPYQNGSWNSPYFSYELHAQSDGDIQVNLNIGGTGYIVRSSGVGISAGEWHYLTFTWDGTTPKLYIDGALKLSSFESGSPTGTVQNYDTNLWIGWRTGAAAGTDDWDGFIDDVRIYNYARTAEQIRADYLAGAAGRGAVVVQSSKFKVQNQSEGLVGYWKMDESSWTVDCATNTVMDSSGAGNHGLACPNAGGLAPSAGKFGNAGVFDGTEDYVKLPDIDF